MPDTKISGLPAGAPAQSTDLFPIARSGSNYSLKVSDIVTVVPGVTNITSAAGTTTLTASSTFFQHVTGTSTQTIKLPDETTIPAGTGYVIDNDSTGNVTVNDSSGTTLATITPGMAGLIYSASNSTATGNWFGYGYVPGSGPSGPITWGTSGLNMQGQSLTGASALTVTNALSVPSTASSVNYWQLSGTTTGIAPQLQTTGSDTNVGFTASTKGIGAYGFYTNSFSQLEFAILHAASAVNYLTVTGSATTNPPVVSAAGSDTNISLSLTPKGTGAVNITNGNLQLNGSVLAKTNTILYTSGTNSYTPTTGAIAISVLICAAGGGGGSGALTAGGVGNSCSGGGGGGAACSASRHYRVSDFVTPLQINIGAGGAGGVAQTTNSSAGNNGSAGGDTSIVGNSGSGSIYFKVYGGGGGAGGQLNAASGGGGGGGAYGVGGSSTGTGGGTAGFQGGGAGGSGGNGNAPGYSFGEGGGGGGGGGSLNGAATSTNNLAYSLGAGGGGMGAGILGGATNTAYTGGTGGGTVAPGNQITANTNATTPTPIQMGPGGGGGSSSVSANGSAGGNSVQGGGGGGGGSAINGNNSGAGGTGGNGFVFIVEYF